MTTVTAKQLIKAIERKGWVLLRISGSHHIYGRDGSIVRLSVPVHGNKPMKKGLVRHLMKLADIVEEDI